MAGKQLNPQDKGRYLRMVKMEVSGNIMLGGKLWKLK